MLIAGTCSAMRSSRSANEGESGQQGALTGAPWTNRIGQPYAKPYSASSGGLAGLHRLLQPLTALPRYIANGGFEEDLAVL